MNKVLKNYLYNLSYQILAIFVPLITTPYVSRVLGAKGVGIFSYTHSIVHYFIIFGCLGLNLYGQREIAYVQHDRDKRDKVFWELVLFRIITVSISLLIFFFAFAFRGKYATYFLIMCLDILASMVDISWFFQGIEDFKKIVARNFIIKIVGTLLIFLLVKTSDDLYLYVICHSATLFLGNLSMWMYIPKLVGKSNTRSLEIKKYIKPTIVLFVPQIAISIYTLLDKTMIGLLTGVEEEVAYYEQGQKIVKIVMTLITSLGTVMLPRVANLFKQNEMDKVKSYLAKSFRVVFFLSFPMMFGLIAMSCNLVPWFFGSEYDKVIPNMMTIAPILVMIAFSNLIGNQYLLPTGRQKEYTLSVITGCCVNFVMNLVLIPRFLSIGAAIATVIAETSVTGVQIFFTRNDFNFGRIVRDNIQYVICSVAMFILTYLLAHYFSPSIINTFLCVIIGCVVYIGLLLIMKDQQVFEVIDKIKDRIMN